MGQTAPVARMPCERTTGRYGICVIAAPGQLTACNKATQERGIGNAAIPLSASEREEHLSLRRGPVPNALYDVRIRCESKALDACVGGFGLDLGGPPGCFLRAGTCLTHRRLDRTCARSMSSEYDEPLSHRSTQRPPGNPTNTGTREFKTAQSLPWQDKRRIGVPRSHSRCSSWGARCRATGRPMRNERAMARRTTGVLARRSRDRARVRLSLEKVLCGQVHATRLLSIANTVVAMMASASVAIHATGQAIAKFNGETPKNGRLAGRPPARQHGSLDPVEATRCAAVGISRSGARMGRDGQPVRGWDPEDARRSGTEHR